MVVFPASGNVSFSLLEYRLGHRSLLGAFFENFTWVPFLCVLTRITAEKMDTDVFLLSFIFFGGLSIHISQAILAHLFSYNITWGATKKEVERSNFWMEVPKILKRFWLSLLVSTLSVMAVIGFATKWVPAEWRIETSSWSLILPLAYVLSIAFRSIAHRLTFALFRISAGSHILYPVSIGYRSRYRHCPNTSPPFLDRAESVVDDLLVLNLSFSFSFRLRPGHLSPTL